MKISIAVEIFYHFAIENRIELLKLASNVVNIVSLETAVHSFASKDDIFSEIIVLIYRLSHISLITIST